MTWIHFSSSQCKYSPHPGGRLQLKHCYIWSPISIKLFETCYQLLSQSQVRLNTSFRIFNAWSYLRISARLLVGWYNCITSQSGRQGTYLARGLVGDSADDPLDALHPHLQLHAGVPAHCPSPHRVVVVLAVVVYLSTGRRGWARQPLPAAHFTDGSAWTGSGRAQLRQCWMLCLTLHCHWWWWYHSAGADKGPVSAVSTQLRSALLH